MLVEDRFHRRIGYPQIREGVPIAVTCTRRRHSAEGAFDCPQSARGLTFLRTSDPQRVRRADLQKSGLDKAQQTSFEALRDVRRQNLERNAGVRELARERWIGGERRQ